MNLFDEYMAIAANLPEETILLWRLGDFYEMFGEHAKRGAKLFNVALTRRGTMPMAGIPVHASRQFFTTVGVKIAIRDTTKAGRFLHDESEKLTFV